ncbi:MAG: PHB depolymerase family esterase [Rhodocyclaceae bacterium]|nr:PHB depolymerase family esterase [Rhodocyclaceae bacterium]
MATQRNTAPLFRTLLLAFLAACAALAAPAQAADVEPASIATADGPRNYLLARPATPGSGPRPLVIVLHGHGGSAALALGQGGRASPLARWLAIADREQVLVAALDGALGGDGRRGWNDCRRDAADNPATDDVAFAGAVVRRLVDAGAVDPTRVYVMGMSNGGMMAFRLALELEPAPAAFAAASAAMAADSACGAARRPVSALLINGTADPLVPYFGGGVGLFRKDRGTTLAVEAAAAFWRRADGLAEAGAARRLPHRAAGDPTSATVTLWGRDSRGPQVELVRIDGGGHIEPSIAERYRRAYERLVGWQNHDLEAAEEAWQFFRDKRARP